MAKDMCLKLFIDTTMRIGIILKIIEVNIKQGSFFGEVIEEIEFFGFTRYH